MFLFLANLLIRSALIVGAGALLCRMNPRLRPAQRRRPRSCFFCTATRWPLLAVCLPNRLPLGRHTSCARYCHRAAVRLAARRQARFTGYHLFANFALEHGCVHRARTAGSGSLACARFMSGATCCGDASWNALLKELAAQLGVAKPPVLLIHRSDLMPMASGLFRPAILLPRNCRSWTDARRRIVLLHELAHISRRDLLSQSLARLVAAAWWFQPLTWGALRLLRRESERACDQLVISTGIRASDYGAELVAIAQTFTAGQPGLAMARPDGLESRLNSILQPMASVFPRSDGAFAVLTHCLDLCGLGGYICSRISIPVTTRSHYETHTFRRIACICRLSAATIGGAVYDPSGAAVPNAKALLIDPDTNAKFEATTARRRQVLFRRLPAGQYILRVQSPGFATLFRELNVKG